MIRFKPDRHTAVLYTCGICNLNCRYCQIDKNPILKRIDDALEESFKGDYYFNRIRAYFPRKDQLKEIQTWGGEPFMRMDRIYPLMHKIIEYYPYFEHMYSSTNFSYDTWLDQFIGLMQCFADYPDRKFIYTLQLSVDGPEYINDRNRGKGVTAKCVANFDKLIEVIKAGKFPSNVTLDACIKGTWDNECIRDLNDKQKLIEFFKFYEDTYIAKIRELNMPNIMMGTSIPNTAMPSPVTKKDGKIFAELVAKCREIERENALHKIFKYYTCITPFSNGACDKCYSYRFCGGICGTGTTLVGFLPDNMVSTCHEGFVQLVEQYKKLANDANHEIKTIVFDRFIDEQAVPMCVNDDQYQLHEDKMESFLQLDTTHRLVTDTALIMALALDGQIDSIYLDEKEALRAARYILAATAFCIKDNYNITGSYFMQPVGMFKLLLNGALPYLTQEDIYGY